MVKLGEFFIRYDERLILDPIMLERVRKLVELHRDRTYTLYLSKKGRSVRRVEKLRKRRNLIAGNDYYVRRYYG